MDFFRYTGGILEIIEAIKNAGALNAQIVGLSTTNVLIRLGLSALMGVYIYFIYRVTAKSGFYNRDFNKSLAVLSVVTTGIILAMQQLCPNLDKDFSVRWKELRKDLFGYEYISQKINGYLDILDASGAPVRDQETWGLFYEDAVERMYQFVEDRLDILDAYYAG